jgi:adenosine deaminase
MVHANELRRFVEEIPKVELHLHLEGAVPFQTLFDFIQREGTEPSIKSVDDLRGKLAYTDFAHFIETWKWVNRFLGEEKYFEEIAYQVLRELARQNVRYVEVSYAPGDYVARPSSAREKTAYVVAGCEKAGAETGIGWGLIIDFCRADSPGECIRIVDDLAPWVGRGLVGVDLGGGRQLEPVSPYVPVFEEARARGLHAVAHAGESAGPESIWAALRELGVERIGHGVRAHEDPRLVSLLREKQVPLEMCVTSNVRTGVVESVEAHPIRRYFEQGLLVTVNSDDPTMFDTSITREYLILAQQLGFTADELRTLSLSGVEASFLSDEEKESMRAAFEGEWELLLSKYGRT